MTSAQVLRGYSPAQFVPPNEECVFVARQTELYYFVWWRLVLIPRSVGAFMTVKNRDLAAFYLKQNNYGHGSVSYTHLTLPTKA